MHDPVLPVACHPYTGAAVRALTMAQLTEVRCAGQPVPRLTDLVARLSRPDARNIGLMAEGKDVDPAGIRDALAPLGWRRTIIESFNWQALASIERVTPQVPTCPLGVTAANLTRALLVTHDCVGPEQHAVTADLISRAHEAGVGILVWTVDDRRTMRRLADEGVDGLITDRPRTALALLHAP
jgi:glycerophosphoryl diester phosphodiesterase